MRVSLLVIVAAFACPAQTTASAQLLPLDALPMSGPFATLTAACDHLARSLPTSTNWTPTAPAHCRQLDAVGPSAIVLAEREDELGTARRSQRLYATVLHRRDGWWMSPDAAHSYKDGDAASMFGSNCCHAAESPPTYATWTATFPGFRGTATILRVVMHGWSVAKRGWPDEGKTGNSQTQVSFTICGTSSTSSATCYAIRSACSCMASSAPSQCLTPHVPRVALDDDHLVLACPART